MASMALTGSLPKFLPVGTATFAARRSPWRRGVVAANPRPFQERKPAKEVEGEAKKAGQHVREMVTSATDQVVANAQDLSDKAKQTVQDAWGSAKEAADKVKETVAGKAEDAEESVKDSAEAEAEAEGVKRAMNNKNC